MASVRFSVSTDRLCATDIPLGLKRLDVGVSQVEHALKDIRGISLFLQISRELC